MPRSARVVVSIAALLFAMAIGAVAMWLFVAGQTGQGDGGGPVGNPLERFTISGELPQAVIPGASVPLDLEFVNPHDSAMTVVDLRVTVRDVTAPNANTALPCTIDDFIVTQAPSRFELRLDANGSSTLTSARVPLANWPTVGMLDSASNQDGCKGATLVLAYSASGRLQP